MGAHIRVFGVDRHHADRARMPLSAAGLLGCVVAILVWPAAASAAPSCTADSCTVDFAATGANQTWTVPAGISEVTITAAGGSGGKALSTGALGGGGGKVMATVPVTAGASLTLVVGSAGTDGQLAAVPYVAATGGFGGGGDSAAAENSVLQAGGGGGGATFVFDAHGPLLVAGGGGGAPGGTAYAASSGGAGGGGGSAGTVDLTADPLSGAGATTSTAGTGGVSGNAPTPNGFIGLDGTGPATSASVIGAGGAGATNKVQVDHGTAGGGGGGYFGGGGGGTDGGGKYTGGGGGGSGYAAASVKILAQSVTSGDGWVSISYAKTVPVPSETTTSGTLRYADTGQAIPNSCVVFSPVAAPGQTNYTSANGDGSWSFSTTEAGPFNLAFYTTADGDCSQPILSHPVPSWYVNRPLTGTDEHIITPPSGAGAVAAGASNVVACLGANALPIKACAAPRVVLSGHAYTKNMKPVANVCVFALAPNGDGVVALTDANGAWHLAGIPTSFRVVIAFIPNFGTTAQPCQGNGTGPPVPGVGKLQPVFFHNVWLNLGDPVLLHGAYAWGVAHGATVLTGARTGIDGCLTTAAGSVVPRPTCAIPTARASGGSGVDAHRIIHPTHPVTPGPSSSSSTLANTGVPLGVLVPVAALLLGAGLALEFSGLQRRRDAGDNGPTN